MILPLFPVAVHLLPDTTADVFQHNEAVYYAAVGLLNKDTFSPAGLRPVRDAPGTDGR